MVFLYDRKVRNRRFTSLATHNVFHFRNSADTENKESRTCIEYMTDFQKDIPAHALAPKHLLALLNDIFPRIALARDTIPAHRSTCR